MAFQRTNTSARTVVNRTNQATMSFDTSSPSAYVTTVSIFRGSHWTSGLHWHETHTEYLQIVQGRAIVQLGEHRREYGPEDGVIRVDKFVLHEWGTAPTTASEGGVTTGEGDEDDEYELVVREWTDPADGQKEIFFRNLMGVLEDEKQYRFQWMMPIQMFVIFGVMDNYPVVFMSRSKRAQAWATYLTMYVAATAAILLGMQGVYREYTPQPLYNIWKGEHGREVQHID